ncbi:MAG TPA: YCF48-related protein [Symbiobacteriaceae bacterium]|jgi:photosystem II stability/assembly factor-like uncharacterized protein
MRRTLASFLTLILLGLTACSLAPKPAPGSAGPAGSAPKIVTATVKPIATEAVNLTALAFAPGPAPGPGRGFMANGPALLTSTDGGQTWAKLSDLGGPVNGLDFVSPDLGWAAAGSGLLATRDGGKTWQNLASGAFKRVDFADDTRGWALDDKLTLTSSADGGKTWAKLPSPCGDGAAAGAFSFVSPTTGWMLCGGQPGAGQQQKSLFRTADGGQHWTPVAAGGLPGSGYVADLFFLDAGHGWFSLTRGGLYATADGGKTWTMVKGLSQPDSFKVVRFVSLTQGYLIQDHGGTGLIATTDGGATWAPVYPALRPHTNLPQRAFDMQNWLSVGDRVDMGAVLKSADGGRTWKQAGSLGPEPVFDISFPDPQHGWAVTDHWTGKTTIRTVQKTTDGGATWTQVSQAPDDPSEFYNSICFPDDQTGFAASRSRLSVTTDGGATFRNVDDTPDSGYQFQFTDKSHGWKIRNFKLDATADGGKSWQPINLDTRVQTFQLLPGGAAWVIGGDLVAGVQKPALFATRDGGNTWTRYDLGNLAVAALRFVDATHGLVVGEDDHLYATEDGGQTWTQLR